MLATTAAEPVLRVWYPGEGQWECLYGLKHCQPVSVAAWCTTTGKGESPLLMLARYADDVVDAYNVRLDRIIIITIINRFV